jgi:hypothetical protein
MLLSMLSSHYEHRKFVHSSFKFFCSIRFFCSKCFYLLVVVRYFSLIFMAVLQKCAWAGFSVFEAMSRLFLRPAETVRWMRVGLSLLEDKADHHQV